MDYINASLNPKVSGEEIIRLFYLHPLSKDDKRKYSLEEQKQASLHLLFVLREASIEYILDVIEKHRDEISPITTMSVPQFSNIYDADRIPDIIISNPGCKYKLIGYYFNKSAEDYSHQKYGENHYKLAAQLGLCEYADKHSGDGITEVTQLGMIYKDLTAYDKDKIRARLCLQVPFIQYVLIEARHHNIDAMGLLLSMFTQATAVRRRSSIQQMMRMIESQMTTDKQILQNISWGYKK